MKKMFKFANIGRRLVAVLMAAGAAAAFGGCAHGDSLGVPAAASVGAVKPLVVIDAGHGGSDGGGVSVNGVPEKGINLNIAATLSDMLRAFGYRTVLTRTADVSIYDKSAEGEGLRAQKLSDMKNRLALFNTEDAVCISVHQNRYTDPVYHGAQMFFHRENAEGAQLAECLRARICSLLQPDNQRETKPMDDELYLLCNCKNPAVMAECGFISNPEEAAMLEQEPYQRQMAFALMCGMNDFCYNTGRVNT